ncbi:MAG: hypothetical protein K2K38_01620 [Clostridia bacterium]|nr:hypothetical protein [Clostridia bacterium]
MNRGFGFYFGHAIKSSARTLWHKGNLFKYFVWVVMELLCPFTVILWPMFALANVRQAKIAERENTVDIPQSFKVACKLKPCWTMILATVLEALIFLAGVILIGVAGGLLSAVGYVVSIFVSALPPQIIMLIFVAPAVLVFLVYCIIMPMLFAPTAYIIETNPDLGASDAISICFNTMKSRGKGTLFLNYLIPALVEGAILGLLAGIEIVLGFFVNDLGLAVALAILVGIIFFVAFALVVPMFTLARKISNKSLFEDIALDPVNAYKRTSGVNIERCKGVKFDPAEYENELSSLFDETFSDRVPVPETPSAMRRRQLEERRAARAASVDYTKTLLEDTPAYTPAPVTVSDAGEEDDGELLTVSDLIRDVVEEEPAKEEPAPVVEEPATEVHVEPVAEIDPVKTEVPVEPVAEIDPVKTEVPVEPVAEIDPVKTEVPAQPVAKVDLVKTEVPAQPAPVKTAVKTTVKATTKTAATTVKAKTTATVKAKTSLKKPTGGEENK